MAQTERIVIHIDQREYKVEQQSMTGAQLRQVPTPAIASDLDLWEEVPGSPDQPVGGDTVITLRDGMHFFTVPATITPGVSP